MLLHKRLPVFALLTVAIVGCNPPSRTEADGTTTGAETVEGASVGEVTRIRGPKGLSSPDLPPGTFMGEGAKLSVGQVLEVPAGTQAELAVGEHAIVRVNEDTQLKLTGADKLHVERGEIVVMLSGGEDVPPFEVQAAEELLLVHDGEAQVRHEGETRHYAVVSGTSELRAGSETVELGPGASIDIPYQPPVVEGDDPDPTPKPLVSLQPLEDAAWAASFDAAARMAETVPRGVGSLTARRAGSRAERQSLRLIDQKVMVNISGRIAHTEIEQSFYNESGQTMEGIYRFPLPADASISGLQLLVGSRWMDGEMVEKQRAKQIFQQIVDATVPRDPALLHWEQGNVFKLRIFPIPGRGERKIRLSYTQVLPSVGDAVRYRYPMGGSGATEAAIDDFEFTIRVDKNDLDEDQIDDISTPMMRLRPEEREGVVLLSAKHQDYLPTSDLGVDIPVAENEARLHTETYLDRDGQAYFMLSMQPQLDVPRERRPVDYAFVLDRSHSTTPELWTLARGIVGAMLDTLEPEDRFTVLACDTACDASHKEAVTLGESNIDDVEKFLDAQVMGGASDLGAMLHVAGRGLRAGASDRDRVVVYLGDGVPTSGPMAADELSREGERALDGVRLQAVALGSRSDLLVLESLVQGSGGDLLRADPRDDRARLVRELQLRSRVPAAHDVQLELPEGMFDVHPKQLAAIRPGQTVNLIGKFDRPIDGEVRFKAHGPMGEVTESFPVRMRADRDTGTSHAHLPRTWAQEQIEHLTTKQGHSAKRDIVSLSQMYNVLSRYTALIVLENDRMYREFRVARRAGRTDKWSGELANKDQKAAEIPADGSGAEQSAFPAGGAVDEAVPMREEAERSKSEAASGAPQPSPAPESEPDEDWDDAGPVNDRRVADASRPDASESNESYDFEDDGDFASQNRGSGKSASAQRPAKKSKPKKYKKSAGKSDMGALDDPFDGGGGGGGGGGYAYEKKSKGYYSKPRPQIRIRDASEPSGRTLDRIAQLRSARDAQPEERSKHRSLVRAAIYAGHAQAMAFAQAWAAADPDHSHALLAMADILAAKGDPNALRAYASAVEVNPFSTKLHRRMATAYEGKGDFGRACSHRRALVSINPKSTDDQIKLARCFHRGGQIDRARVALQDASERVRSGRSKLSSVERDLNMSPTPVFVSLHGYPEIKAVLTWSTDDDLDIAVVDKRGRRLSAMRPERVRVREERGRETLTLSELNGALHVEVTRIGANSDAVPIHAQLEIRTPYGSRTFPVDIDHGTLRIAKVQWNQRY
jgi:mannose-6-phosphate isomerase-like protein (cupin superfamily)/tetratricopeptide (TPR) repeat protein